MFHINNSLGFLLWVLIYSHEVILKNTEKLAGKDVIS